MEDQYVQDMKDDLDGQVAGKNTWLKTLHEICNDFSIDIGNLACCTESISYTDLFQVYNNISGKIINLAKLIPIPQFAVDFAENIGNFNNSVLV